MKNSDFSTMCYNFYASYQILKDASKPLVNKRYYSLLLSGTSLSCLLIVSSSYFFSANVFAQTVQAGDTITTADGPDIIFDTVAGTVRVDGNVLVDSLTFNVDGFTVEPLGVSGSDAFDTTGGAVNTIINISNGLSAIINVEITGSENLVLDGGGTVDLSAANTFTGTTTVNDGILDVTGSLASTTLAVNNDGTLQVDGASLDDTAAVTLSDNGTLALTGNETIGSLAGASTTSSVILNANTLTTGDGNNTDFAGDISGAGNLIKQGTGTFTLSGANTFTGTTTVNDGILDVTGSLASTVIDVTDGTLITDGGAFASGAAVSVGTSTLTINGTENITSLTQTDGTVNGIGTITTSGAFTQSGGATSGTIDINSNGFIQSNGATIAAATSVTSSGDQILNGGNILGALDGLGNVTIQTGNTFVTGAGTIASNNIDIISGSFSTDGNSLSVSSNINIASNATFNTTGIETISTITNAGNFNVTNATINGLNNFTNNGRFNVFGTNNLTFNGGNTFTNQSNGIVNLSNNVGGDTLEINGNLVNQSGSQYFLDLNLANPTNASQNDQIVVNGTITGSTELILNDLDNGNNTVFVDNLILIASTGGISAGSDFSISGLNNGLFSFATAVNGNNVVLQSTLNTDAAGGIVSTFIAAQDAITTAFFKPASGLVTTPLDPSENQIGFAPWFRTNGGFTEVASSGTASLPSGSASDIETTIDVGFGGYQFGLDGGLFNIKGTGAALHLGITGGQIFGQANQQGFNNTTDISAFYGGVYSVFSYKSFFLDAQIRQEFIDFNVNVNDTLLQISDEEVDSRRFSGSISAGYSFNFNDWSIVPVAGYSFSQTNTSNLNISENPLFNQSSGTVSFDDTISQVLFGGASVGRSFSLFEETVRVSPFLSLTGFYDFDGETNSLLTFGEPGNQFNVNVTTESATLFGQISIGVNVLTLSPEIFGEERLLTGNIRLDGLVGEDILGGSLTAQMRLQF